MQLLKYKGVKHLCKLKKFIALRYKENLVFMFLNLILCMSLYFNMLKIKDKKVKNNF